MINKIIDKIYGYFLSKEAYARRSGVAIGKNCAIGTKNFGSEPYLVEIGDHVQITNDVKFFTHGGGWVFRNEYPEFDYFGKITVGDNVYIGNNAMILPGVTIGNNVIIGAGAIVTKSVVDNTIIAGNPAKVIGKVDELKHKVLPYNLNSKRLSPSEKKSFLLKTTSDKFIVK